MSYAIGQHSLETPLVSAAGLINGIEVGGILRGVETLTDTSIGAITVGSFTIPRRLGIAAQYGEPTSYYNHLTGEMTNALGLPNIGIEAGEQLVDKILNIAGEKPVIFSVSPVAAEAGIGNSVEQSVELVNRLFAAGAKLVELNVSCPNVVTDDGGRKPIMGYDYQTMSELVEALCEQPDNVIFRQRLGIKLPPYTTVEHLRELERIGRNVIANAPIGYIAVSNTIPGGRPIKDDGKPILSAPNGVGGSSGPATKTEGRLQLAMWRRLTPDLPIISMLGVYDGAEMAARRVMGAAAVGMNTRLWLSTNWKHTVSDVLAEYVDAISD